MMMVCFIVRTCVSALFIYGLLGADRRWSEEIMEMGFDTVR